MARKKTEQNPQVEEPVVDANAEAVQEPVEAPAVEQPEAETPEVESPAEGTEQPEASAEEAAQAQPNATSKKATKNQDVPGFVDKLLKTYCGYDKLYIDEKGGVFTENTQHNLIKDAILYQNPYYKQ